MIYSSCFFFFLIFLGVFRNHRHTLFPSGLECSFRLTNLPITHIYLFPYQFMLFLFMRPKKCFSYIPQSVVEHQEGSSIRVIPVVSKAGRASSVLEVTGYQETQNESIAIIIKSGHSRCHWNTQ